MSHSILITGCSSGIGLDAAVTLKARGWRVFASCRKKEDCQRLQAEGFESPQLDLADSASIETAVASVLETNEGRLDALFNNGAFGVPGLVQDLPRDALRSIFETNLFGQIELSNLVLPVFLKQGHGRIINCSSVLGFAAMPYRGAYNATKFALEGITDTLRLELADTPLHVVLIQPGPIATRIRENSIPHFERWIDVDRSLNSEAYRRVLMPRLYEPGSQKSRFELEAAAVTEAVIHALESARPRAKYRITVPTQVAWLLKRLLSTRMVDRISRG